MRGALFMTQKDMILEKHLPINKISILEQGAHRYTLSSCILLFFTFSFFGWLWEVLLHLYMDHALVNRGVLFGPWLPIYGFGGVFVLIFFHRFSGKPYKVFFLTMLMAGTMEFLTGSILWKVYHMRWWDYSNSLINIKGYVCLEGLLLFGIAGLSSLYIISPLLDRVFLRIPRKFRYILCGILVVLFFLDAGCSLISPNIGLGITAPH